MTEPEKPSDPAEPSPAELGRAYGALLRSWDRDVPEAPDVGEPPASPGPPPPERIIEALLFIGGEPLTPARAVEIVRGLSTEQFRQAIDALNYQYRRQARPYAIVPQGQGFVLTLRPRYGPVVERLFGGVREARLSPAAIDVLALVAYRQPVTKVEIDAVRGVDSGHLLRQLVRRGLTAVFQRADSHQRDITYGTTSRFLELFGLSSLDDLPRTQELQQM